MRYFEIFLLSPFFTLAVALVLVVLAPKLSSQTENSLLVISWLLVVASVFRTPPVSRQILIPRILLTLVPSAVAGLALCWLAGWRPVISAHPLGFMAITSNVEYPAGTRIGGIAWGSRFNDLRILVVNETELEFSDIDLVLRPNVPVAGIGQVSNLPNVTFSPVADPVFTQELFVGETRKRIVNPLVLAASDGGYRVLCKSLPRKSKLELTMATAEIIDFPKAGASRTPRPDGGIFDRDYVIKVEMKNNDTKVITNNWYGHGAIEEIYKATRPIPSVVQINGHCRVDEEDLTISQQIDAKDVIGDFLRGKFGQSN
jgi:hypothetical protein